MFRMCIAKRHKTKLSFPEICVTNQLFLSAVYAQVPSVTPPPFRRKNSNRYDSFSTDSLKKTQEDTQYSHIHETSFNPSLTHLLIPLL